MSLFILFLPRLVFGSHSNYAFCMSDWTLLPDAMKKSATISSCFKATSVLNNDALNVAQHFCDNAWARKSGLVFHHERDWMEAAVAVYFNKDGSSFNSLEECERFQKQTVEKFQGDAESESNIGEIEKLLHLRNGLIPSVVSASQFYTLRLHCIHDGCF